MEKSYFLSTAFNEVIFRGRNHAYGAYTLRKQYSKNIFIAAILATSIFSGALVGPLVNNILFPEAEKYSKPVYTIIEPYKILPPPIVEPKKIEVIAAKAETVPKIKTEKYVAVKVVSNSSAITEELVPEQDKLSTVHIGTNSIDGELPATPAIASATPAETEAGANNKEVTAPFYSVEQMPEYVGGEKAMLKYLGRNIKYPAAAQQEAMEGVVVVSFVISPTGEITDTQVLKGLGYGMDEEALRVISSMPQWKPGRQNGKTVPVRYTLPIRFNIK